MIDSPQDAPTNLSAFRARTVRAVALLSVGSERVDLYDTGNITFLNQHDAPPGATRRRTVLAQRLSEQSHCIRGHDIRPMLDNGVENPNVFYRAPERKYGRQCWACSRGRARINQRVRYWRSRLVEHQSHCTYCQHHRRARCDDAKIIEATLNHHLVRLREWQQNGRPTRLVA